MRVVHVLWLFVQAIVLVEAANVKWTLHKSCCTLHRADEQLPKLRLQPLSSHIWDRSSLAVPVCPAPPRRLKEIYGIDADAGEDKTKDGSADDNELAAAMIDALETARAWALQGATKLEQSADRSPLHGVAVKNSVRILLGPENYRESAKEVSQIFKKFENLEGPIGRTADAGGRFDESEVWQDAKRNENHHLDFLLVCRPELDKVDDFSGAMTIPYDKIRERLLFTNADLEIFIKEETEFDKWSSLRNRIQAVTSVDSAQPPSGQRLFVPEAIFFHPLWIKHQTEKKFGGWSRELFNDVTADNALEKFKTVGQQRELDIRPVDGLLEASFVRNVLHEMFHLTAFGGLHDRGEQPYGWASNVEQKDRENPDFLTIIAVVIELLSREGQKFKVAQSGEVSRR